MRLALHGMVTMHSNVLSDIRLASASGYEGLEIHTQKLWRYVTAGGTTSELKHALAKHNIAVSGIDIIGGIEVGTKDNIERVEKEAVVLSKLASEIGAPTIQLNAFEGLNGLTTGDNIRLTASMIKRIVKIGREYNIRFQYEGAAWTPIHTLEDCIALIEEVGECNFGHVIDFWHLWASRGASPDDVARLDPKSIFAVHCCGGTRPPCNPDGLITWVDERELRGYFPGDVSDDIELLPAKEWMDAVLSTGFDGWVSGEFLNDALWEQDNLENAKRMREGIVSLLH